jgi:hypothetical protein
VSNNLTTSQNFRYFRSINWGGSWTGATITTGFQDFNPSAAFKYNGDSVYIAVERRISFSDRQIRLLATKFTPGSAFGTKAITTGGGILYELPCLNIKQNNPVDSMILSCTKNDNAVYFFSTNTGSTWSSELALTSTGGVVSTYCSSSISGSRPFTVCWSNDSPSTLNVRRGSLGNFENTYDNVNNYNTVSRWVDIVCQTVQSSGNNMAAVAYAGYGPQDLNFDLESNRILYLSAVPEAMYNRVTNQLNRQDTLSVYLRKYNSPHAIIDSSEAYVDRYTLSATVYFSRAQNENYYVEVRTKNTIAAWGYWPDGPNDFYTLDMLRYNYNTFGYNVALINNVLNYYGMYSGDVNQDGIIDGTDTQLIDNDANAFVTGYSIQDLNGDNFVDGTDALTAGNNAFNFISVITPP